MEKSTLIAIRTTAEQDYFCENGDYKNPYQIGTEEFNYYERGWMQSLKKDGGKQQELMKNRTLLQARIKLSRK